MLLELYDEGYKIRKAIEIDGDFYTWTRQTYKDVSVWNEDDPFKDSVTDDNVEFNGEFDHLNINIQSKGSDIEKTGIHHLEGSVDVDSIKDNLIEIIDYSNSEGYDITLFFSGSAPFDKEILTQPGYEQFGYTYQTILDWEPSYITMTIHRNTVYELKTFNESTLPKGILINTVKNLEVPEELEDLISRNGYFMNRIIANIDDVWFDYNKGLYSQPEWSHINYSTYIDPNASEKQKKTHVGRYLTLAQHRKAVADRKAAEAEKGK